MGCQSPHRDKSPLSRVGFEKPPPENSAAAFLLALPRFALLERIFIGAIARGAT